MSSISIISKAWGFLSGGSAKIVWLLGGALALSILIGWLFWSRAAWKADYLAEHAAAEQYKAANTANLATISELQKASKQTEAALAEREITNQELTKQSAQWRRKWREAIKNDQKVRAWADTPLPDAVRQLLN